MFCSEEQYTWPNIAGQNVKVSYHAIYNKTNGLEHCLWIKDILDSGQYSGTDIYSGSKIPVGFCLI